MVRFNISQETALTSTFQLTLEEFEKSVLPHIEKGHALAVACSIDDLNSENIICCDDCGIDFMTVSDEVLDFLLNFISQSKKGWRFPSGRDQ